MEPVAHEEHHEKLETFLSQEKDAMWSRIKQLEADLAEALRNGEEKTLRLLGLEKKVEALTWTSKPPQPPTPQGAGNPTPDPPKAT